MPATRPSHQDGLISLVMTAEMMSSVPLKMSSSPSTEARDQKASMGRANDQIAPTVKKIPSRMCAHCQLWPTEARTNSLTVHNRNNTPSRTPTVVIEAGLNRSTIKEMISHAMPVTRNTHQGPASRHSPARVLDLMAVRSSMALMNGFLSAQVRG